MHIIFFPSILVDNASQINLREEPQAKSRTLSALKIQVFFLSLFCFSAAFASSNVTTSTGSDDNCALFHLANWAAESTAG